MFNGATNFYNLNNENFHDFLMEMYRKIDLLDKDTNYIRNHLIDELRKELRKIIANGELIVDIESVVDDFLSNGLDENKVVTDIKKKLEECSSQLNHIENKKLNNDTLYVFSPFKNNIQGDCFILNYNDKTILIDTGYISSADTVINYIKSKNINKIDYMFITHYHPDHCTALSKLVENLDFSSCKFLLPPPVDWSRFLGNTTTLKNNEQSVLNVITTNAFNYIYLTHEYVLTIDNIKLRFLNCNTVNYEYYYSVTGDSNGPIKNDTTNYNNFSVGLIVEHEKNKLYFPSDIDIKGQEVTLSEVENVDFMCYPHHGCNELSYDSFLNVLSPRIALATGVGLNRNTSSDYRKLLSSTIAYQNKEDFELLSSGNSIKVLKGSTVFTPGFPGDYGTPIANGSDLNSFIDEGKYISSNGGVSATLLNTPVTTSGFKLEVNPIIQNSALIQTLTANNSMIVKYERYYNCSTKTFGRWIYSSKRNNADIPTNDTTILNDFIDSMYDGQYQFLNIPKTSTMFSELSDKINDVHGLFLRIEKMNNSYSILTLTGKSVEKMFIGRYVSGTVTWKEVTLV